MAKLGQYADVHDSFAELLRTMDRKTLVGWIAAAAELPKMQPRPLLIEPDQIPLIVDAERARREPRETIFAALYHVRETRKSIEDRVAGIRAAVIAILTLDRPEQMRYGDLMHSFTPTEIMQRALEELRKSGVLDEPDPDQSVFYPDSYAAVHGLQKGRELMLPRSTLRILEQGQEEGREEGREALHRVILDVLEARGLTLSPTARARIEACKNLDTLAHWCTKAALVGSADELFDEHPLTPPDRG